MKKRLLTITLLFCIALPLLVPVYAINSINPSENETYNYLVNLAVQRGEYNIDEDGLVFYNYTFYSNEDKLFSVGYAPAYDNYSEYLYLSCFRGNNADDNGISLICDTMILISPSLDKPYQVSQSMEYTQNDEVVAFGRGYGSLYPETHKIETQLTFDSCSFPNESMEAAGEEFLTSGVRLILLRLVIELEKAGLSIDDLGFTGFMPSTYDHTHTWEIEAEQKQPTCMDNGLALYVCSFCGARKEESIPATGHSWGEWRVEKPATATSNGYEIRICQNDKSHIESRPIAATGEPEPATSAKPTTKPTTAKLKFKDVKKDAYYYDAVEWAVNHDPVVTTGTDKTHFSPSKPCTRAQMVTFLWRAAGEPKPKNTTNPFKDVKKGAYYYNAVLWAVSEGITTGTSKNTFSPDTTVNRAQTVTFLWRLETNPTAATLSVTVYKTRTGSCYHYAGCKHIINHSGVSSLSLESATAQGLKPCKDCSGGRSAPSSSTSSSTKTTHTSTATKVSTPAKVATNTNPPKQTQKKTIGGFKDVFEGTYYSDAVLWAVANDITTGKSADSFAPGDPCTRAQIVTFLYRDLG